MAQRQGVCVFCRSSTGFVNFLSLFKQFERDCTALDVALENRNDDDANDIFNRLNENLNQLTKCLEEINEKSVNMASKLTDMKAKIVKRPVSGLDEFNKISAKLFEEIFDSTTKWAKFKSTKEIPKDFERVMKKRGTVTPLSSSDIAIRTECPVSNFGSISRTEIAVGSEGNSTKSSKSDERAIRTPRPMDGSGTPDAQTEINLDEDENILPASEAPLSHGSKQMGVSFSEIAIRTAAPSEVDERQSRTETNINSRKKDVRSRSNEVAQRTPPPEGTQDISRTERSVNEIFGSSNESTPVGSSFRKKRSKKESRKKKRTKRRSKSAAAELVKPMQQIVSESEIAIRTAAPLEKYEGVSRTEKRLDLGGESFGTNEIAIRTPPPESQANNMSRTEISIEEDGTAVGITLSKKERRQRGASLYRSPNKDRSAGTQTVEPRGIKLDTVKANEIAQRTPPPEGQGNISRTEPLLDDEPSSKKKSKRSKRKKHVKRHKVNPPFRGTSLKRKQDSRQPSLSSNERAIKTPSLGSFSRTELTIGLGKQRSETAKTNEMAIRTPPPGGASSTDATVNDEPVPTPQKVHSKRVKDKKPSKKSKIKRTFSDLGQKVKTAAAPTQLPTLHFTKSASDRSVRSDRAIRTPPKDGCDTSITETDIDDFHDSLKDMNLFVPLSASERVFRSDRVIPTPMSKDNLEPKSMASLQPSIIAADEAEASSKKFDFDAAYAYKVCKTLAVLLFVAVFGFILVFQSWRLANAITAVYDVSIDDCNVANGLCHKYSMCCFSQCGATRLQIFWSTLFG